MREFQKSINQFWNFGKRGEIFLPIEQINDLYNLLGQIIKAVSEDKQARLEQFKTAKKKMDEEDIEYFHEDIKKVDKIIKCNNSIIPQSNSLVVMEVNGTLVHVYKGQISAALNQTLIPYFGLILQNLEAHEDYEIVNGVCFLCDILEHGGDDIFSLIATRGIEKFIETFERFPLNRGLLQSAGYGLGVIAQRSPKGAYP